MALTGTSYSGWMQQNQPVVEEVTRRYALPAQPAQVTPTVAPAAVPVAEPVAPAPAVTPEAAPAAAATEPATAASPPPVAPVVRPSGSLRGQLAEVNRQELEGINANIGSIGREADTQIEAAKKKAETIRTALPDQQTRIKEVDEIIKGNRDKEAHIRENMMADYEAYRKPIVDDRDGFQKSASVITGIVAAMAQNGLGGPRGSGPSAGGAGLAAGMGMLNAHVNRTFAEQQEKIAAAGRGIDGGSKVLRSLAENSTNELALTERLNANAWGVTEKQLEQIAAESSVPAIKENAFRLQNAAREKGLAHTRAAIEADIAHQAAIAKAAAARQPFAVLIAKEQAGTITREEMKTLTDWRKDQASIAKMQGEVGSQALADAKTQAEIDKLNREAGGQSIDYGDGYVGTRALADGESGKATEIIANKNEAQQYLKTLKDIRVKNGGAGLNADDESTAQLTMGMLAAKLNVLVGQGAMTESDAERIMKSVKNPTDVSMRGDPVKQYDAISQMLESSSAAKLRAYGIQRSDPRSNVAAPVGQPAPAPAGPPPAPARVGMIAPDGSRIDVKPSLVSSFEANGFKLASQWDPTAPKAAPRPAPVPAPAPNVSDMSDAEYAQYVQQQGGY